MTPAAFDAIERFVGACTRWGRVSNLVSASDRARLWERHVLDSLQLVPLAEGQGPVWVDLGSGGGFPGIVVAIAREGTRMTLVEANKKKSAFLLQAAAEAGVKVTVVPKRIEDVAPFAADVVSARALTALDGLIDLARPFFAAHTIGLFPKGREAQTELAAAKAAHDFTASLVPSLTIDSSIVKVTDLRMVT
ncbi:16S rRNA (guanine(527)-N(7))-methyltransferase RsmG [Acuticoccus yangtzensis]|uniref:16S rRNA (guanine(527)-N(7))-methyltransferase RsmG n=1 Tax=Acuticoccus yangtzensis TaxID=1443441 RepID=UPI0009498F66|nr:16S rRNA (guanine(527)-N(7))-methyltransferase RsmG [Acuticoccus yangtzensis]